MRQDCPNSDINNPDDQRNGQGTSANNAALGSGSGRPWGGPSDRSNGQKTRSPPKGPQGDGGFLKRDDRFEEDEESGGNSVSRGGHEAALR